MEAKIGALALNIAKCFGVGVAIGAGFYAALYALAMFGWGLW